MSNAGGSANIGINLNPATLTAAINKIVADANAAIQRVNANAPTIAPSQLTIPNIPQGLDPAGQAAFLNALPGLISRQIGELGRQSGAIPKGQSLVGFTGQLDPTTGLKQPYGPGNIGASLLQGIFGTTDLKAALGAVNSPVGQLSPDAIKNMLTGSLGKLTGSQLFDPGLLDARMQNLLAGVGSKTANLNIPGREFIGDNNPNELATDRVGAAQLEAAILEEIAKRKVLSDAYTEATVSTRRQTAINEAAVQKQLAGDDAYIKAKVGAAAALASEEAKISASLIGTQEYTDAKISSAVSAAQEALIIQQGLSDSTIYTDAKTQTAVLLTQEAAAIQSSLAFNDIYLTAKTDLATLTAIEAAEVQKRLAIDQGYLKAKAQLATSTAVEAAAVQSRLVGNDIYTNAKRDLAIAEARTAAAVTNKLALEPAYAQAKTELATAEARSAAAINNEMAGSGNYIASKTALASSQARLSANLNQALAIDSTYLKSKADLTISQQLLAVAMKAELLGQANGATYIQAKASNAVLLAQEKARLAKTLAQNDDYIRAKADAAIAAKAEAAAISRKLSTDLVGGISLTASNRTIAEGDAARARRDSAALLQSPTYSRDAGIDAANRVRLQTQENIAKLRSIAGDNTLADAKRTELRLKDQILLEELRTFTQVDAAKKAQISIERQRIANLARIAELEFATSAQGQAALREKARGLILQRQYNQALQRELAAELRDQGKPFAALTTRLGGGGFGGGASGGAGAAGFFGGGLMSTLKYSIPSALLFGAVAGIGSTIKEAEELNKTLSLLQGQLDATGKAGDFEGLRDEILSISRETGIAANNVAKFAVQLQGAFGRSGTEIEGLSGDALVRRQVQGVSKLDALLGLDDKQVIDTTVAVGRQFGVLAEQIGNVAFQAQQFGVPAEELQVFLADIAPVAKDAGFSLEQISSIGAAAILNSGKSASSIAEAFGRVIPAVTKAKSQLLELSLSERVLNNERFRTAVATGDTATILTDIGTNLDKISGTSKDFVIQLLGGRREAQSILAAFNDPSLLTEFAFDKNNADAQNAAYDRLQATLGQTLRELSQVLQQLGLALLDAGLADALKFLASSFKEIALLAGGLLDIFGQINKALKGMPVLILAVVAAARLMGGAGSVAGFAGGIINPRTPQQAAAFANLYGSQTGQAPVPVPVNQRDRFGGPGGPGAYGTYNPNVSSLATGLTVAGAALAVGGAVQTYQSTTANLKAQESSLREQLKEASNEQLEDIASQYNGFWDGVQEGIFGIDLPGTMAQQQININRTEESTELLAALEQSEKSAERFFSAYLGEGLSRGQESLRDDLDQYLKDNQDKVREGLSQEALNLLPKSSESVADLAGGGVDPLATGSNIGVNRESATRAALPQITAKNLLDVEFLTQLKKDSDEGNVEASELLNVILSTIPSRDKKVQELVNSILLDLTPEEEKIKNALDASTLSLKEAELRLKEGSGTYASYESALKESIAAKRDAFEDSVGSDAGADYELLAQAIEDEQKLYAQVVERLNATADTAKRIASIGGDSQDSAEAELGAALDALNDPELTNPTDINKFVDAAISAQRSLFEAQLENFDTAAEKLAFANSGAGELDPIVLVKLLEAQLNVNNAKWTELLENYRGFFATAAGSTLESVLTAAALGQATTEEVRAALELAVLQTGYSGTREGAKASLEIDQIWKEFEKNIEEGMATNLAIADAAGLQLPETNSIVSDAKRKQLAEEAKQEAEKAAEEAKRQQEEAQRAAEEARQAAIELQNAQFEYYKILAGGDSLAVANISIDQARFALANAATPAEWQQATNQLAQAERERKEAEDAIVDARFSYAEVLAGDSAIGAAKIAQQRAAKAMQDAEGVAEELEALAQQFSADRAFELAIRSIFDAQANVVAAMAGYLDDSVASANVGLALAERQYQEALKDYNAGLDEGGEKLLGAQANLINAQATARDAELQGKLDELSVQFEFEKISKNQYIQYLKALKQMPDITKKQVLEIDRQIKQLSGELQQDLQFNLPTNLDLPTLYEVRRSIGSSSSGSLATNGGGYNDNRNVNVVINVNNDADRAFVTQVLEDNLGGPPRSGTSGRFY